MKYIAQTFGYLKKNFWLPLVVFLVPSVVACFLSTPYWEVSFVTAFENNPYIQIGTTFHILFGDSWQYLWPVVVVSVLQIVAASLVMSAIDRHLRTGRLSLRQPLQLINVSVFPLAIGVLIMCAVGIVWRFVLFGLVSLVQVIGVAAKFSPGVTLAIISVIAVGLFVVHVMIIMPMLYWAPIMFIYGYRFRDAASMSFKLISGRKTFVGLFLPLLPCAGIQLLMGFLNAPIAVVRIVGCVVFLFTNVYITVYAFMSFYDISDFDRRDVVSYINIPTPPTATKKTAEKPTRSGEDKDLSGEGDTADGKTPKSTEGGDDGI